MTIAETSSAKGAKRGSGEISRGLGFRGGRRAEGSLPPPYMAGDPERRGGVDELGWSGIAETLARWKRARAREGGRESREVPPPGEKRVVVAAGGRGREEEAGGADLRRMQRWERRAEERRLC
jgi:hypothetical protein